MKWGWIVAGGLILAGCESYESTVARCTTQVNKAEVRLSRTTPPQAAVEHLAIAKVELTGTEPQRACRGARKAVQIVRQAERSTAVVYLPLPDELDYRWGTAYQPPTPTPTYSDSGSWYSDSESWSGSSSSNHSSSGDSGGWSGFSGFGGSDSGGWSGGGGGGGSSSGSDGGGW